jgi:hypothetical protein
MKIYFIMAIAAGLWLGWLLLSFNPVYFGAYMLITIVSYSMISIETEGLNRVEKFLFLSVIFLFAPAIVVLDIVIKDPK